MQSFQTLQAALFLLCYAKLPNENMTRCQIACEIIQARSCLRLILNLETQQMIARKIFHLTRFATLLYECWRSLPCRKLRQFPITLRCTRANLEPRGQFRYFLFVPVYCSCSGTFACRSVLYFWPRFYIKRTSGHCNNESDTSPIHPSLMRKFCTLRRRVPSCFAVSPNYFFSSRPYSFSVRTESDVSMYRPSTNAEQSRQTTEECASCKLHLQVSAVIMACPFRAVLYRIHLRCATPLYRLWLRVTFPGPHRIN